jgi:hypothetical protein
VSKGCFGDSPGNVLESLVYSQSTCTSFKKGNRGAQKRLHHEDRPNAQPFATSRPAPDDDDAVDFGGGGGGGTSSSAPRRSALPPVFIPPVERTGRA